MQLNYWAPHVTVAAIIQKENRFLLVEEEVEGALVINQPAGHLENNETFIEAVIRETLEETRWDFTPAFISGLYRWVHNNGETYLRVCFAGNVITENKNLKLDEGITKATWMSIDEIRNCTILRSPLVLKSIEDFLDGKHYPLNLIEDIR